PRRAPFIVNDGAFGLVIHSVPLLTRPDAIIGIFVVGGEIVGVKAAQLGKQGTPGGEEGPRAIIDFADVVNQGVFGIEVSTAEVGGRAIGEDHTASLLQTPVWIEQLASYSSSLGERLEDSQKRREPTRQCDGVIVQEDEDLASRGACPSITGCNKAD